MDIIEHIELRGELRSDTPAKLKPFDKETQTTMNDATSNTPAAGPAKVGIVIDDKPMLMGIKEYAEKHPGAINAAKTTAKYSLIIGLAVAISEVIDLMQKR
jgi:hypothetical protein